MGLTEPIKSNQMRSSERGRCPKDKVGDCPYGNEVGTCFMFCMRELLRKPEREDEKEMIQEEVENE